MFKILIVEDNADKLRNILDSIENKCGIDSDSIDHTVDSFSAKRKIKDNFYDLLIVDIAIPNRKSENIDNEGGIKLVQEILQRKSHYNTPSHIIGLTALNEVFEKATEDLGTSIISVIRYSDNDIEWEEKLITGIEQWQSAKISASKFNAEYDYDIGIITAVDIEAEAVKALSQEWIRIEHHNDATVYMETTFIDNNKKFRVVAASLSQMGMTASAVLSMKLIHNFRPKYLFMPGIAASLKTRNAHGFGDILVVDESWDGGAGKITKNSEGKYKFEKVGLHLRLEQDLSEKIRAIKSNSILLRNIKDNFRSGSPNTELNIHIGSVVSVAGVIANENVSTQLVDQDRKLLGLEMEAYGVYYSAQNCSNPRPKALALKAICDFADSNKDDNYQAYAAYTSAQVMYNFIMSECNPINN